MIAIGEYTISTLMDGKSKFFTQYYLASPLSEGVAINDSGWSRDIPELTETNKYLWTYYVYTTGTSEPEMIRVKGQNITFENENEPSYLTSVTTEITPTQSGSGTPSSSNRRKINGENSKTLIYNNVSETINFPSYYGSFSTDKAPYLFRKTGGSTDVGNREYDTLVGASAVWNQLNSPTGGQGSGTVNGVTFTRNSDGSVTLNGTATDTGPFATEYFSSQYITGHIILVGSSTYKAGHLMMGLNGKSMPVDSSGYKLANYGFNPVILVFEGETYNDEKIYPQLIDLTQFFGSSTIPDYVHSLEQSTAGSGVAWLRQYFPTLFEYHEYDAGTLKSVEGLASHDTTGFNQWDEEWELGVWDNIGIKIVATNAICCKNYIPVLPSTTYYIKTPWRLVVRKYDADKTFKGTVTLESSNTIIIDSDCHFITFCTYSTDNHTVYNHDICINLSNSGYRNGEYEPYWKRSYPLDSTWVGRGLYKLGSDGKPYADGDIYPSSGNGQVRYGVVDLGSLTWAYNSSVMFFQAELSNILGVAYASIPNLVCPKYTSGSIASVRDGSMVGISANVSGYVYVRDTAYTDASTFKTAMSGVYLIYELATPTSATLTPFQSPQICDDFGTEEYVTDCLIPVGHETRYAKQINTVYNGTYDITSGKMMLSAYYPSYNGEEITGEWISDRDVYAEGRLPSKGAEVVDLTPTIRASVDPKYFMAETGENTISISSGEVEVSYYKDAVLGEPFVVGVYGDQGVSVVKVVREYTKSSSSTSLPDNPTWTETEPAIGSNEYLWARDRTDLSNGTSTYGDAICSTNISGIKHDVDRANQSITDKVWESDITTKINQYDGSTVKTIRDRVTQTEQDISGITTRVTDVESETDDLGTRMTSAESSITQNANNISAMVTVNGQTSAITLTQNMISAMTNQFVIKGSDNTTTVISGGKISANSIKTGDIATDAIKSTNYVAAQSGPYSAGGTFLDLSNGNIYTPNFGVQSTSGEAFINGEIIATSGTIGDDSGNYWSIGNTTDSQGDTSASIVGNGSAYIQDGDWQIHNGVSNHTNGSINTQWYIQPQGQGLQITYPYYSGTYYDYGMTSPVLDANSSRYYNGTVSQNFLYIRKHASTIPSQESDWQYLFRVNKDGVAYVSDLYVNGTSIANMISAGVDGGAYLPTSGGTVNGNVTITGTLNATATKANQLTHTLSINGKGFDGSGDVNVGTLGIAYGGTGQTTAANALKALIDGAMSGTSTPTDNDWYLSQYAGGGTSDTRPVKRPISALWTYIKGKLTNDHSNLDDYYVLKSGDTITGSLTIENGITSDSAQLGNLIVTGAGRFTNGLYGDLIGNADTATKAAKVADSNNGTDITFAYSKSGLSTTSWIAAWNGTELRAISPANLRSSIGVINTTGTGNYNWVSSTNDDKLITSNTMAYWNGAYDSSTHASNLEYVKAGKLGDIVTHNASEFLTSSGNASSASKLDSTRSFTIGKTVKNVDWSGAVSFSQAEISDNASTSSAGWMSKDDKVKLNGIETGAQVNTITGVKGNSETNYRTGNVNITASNIGLGNLTNDKQVKGLSSGTTSGHLVTWGSDGYTVADSGIAKESVTTKITLSGTDYSASSNTITITKANLQSAIQDTSLVLMTSAERSKLSSIQVSEGGTIDFSGVTASAPITATVDQTTKAVNITHDTSGVSAGTYRSVTVNTYGHVTAGTNPTTLSGYGITDAKIASGVITLGSNTITPLTASSTLDATKLSGTASINTTGNAGSATRFSTNASITLTGDTTGTSSSTKDWTISTKTDRLSTVGNNRSVATTPNDYVNKIIFQGLKSNGYIGSPSASTYSYLIGLRGWSDNSGGDAHELAFNNDGIYRRQGATDTWGDWCKLIDSGNYNSYSPTLTGTGASGTWGISISGNSNTANSATKATQDEDGNVIKSTYAKLSGATFTGAVNTANNILNSIGDDAYLGDQNIAGCIAIKGKNGATGIYFAPYSGSTWQKISIDGAGVMTITGTVSSTFSGNLTGNASTATKATQDASGNTITSYYCTLSTNQTISGTKTFSAMPLASSGINVSQITDSGGISLYIDKVIERYGVAFRTTSNSGKHGYVQGDWATYNYMYGNTTNILTRGWVFKDSINNKGVASISGAGNAVFNGSVTIGGNATNTSGCRQEYNETLQCLEFVFN